MSVALRSHDIDSVIQAIPGQIAALRRTFESGKTRPLEWRRGQLESIKRMIRENSDALVAAMQADFGKPELEAAVMDLGITQECDLALKNLKRWTRPEKVSTPLPMQPGKSRIVHEPLGVVLIISPWNYPVQLLISPMIGAIAAGNCVALKPSEVTAHTSALLAELVPRYLDPEAITLFEGAVPETTALLEERFDHIFYTGNGTVGRIVMAAAAKHLTPVTLELGGKSPVVVDERANIDVAARRIAWGKFINAGQTCIAPDYILVHASREQELLDALKETVERFYGDNPRDTGDLARIANTRHHQRLATLLKGDHEVVFGGQTDEDACYIAPTLLRGVSPDSAIMSDEIFGPILPVLTVESTQEAIDFINDRDKPLALYVFTENAAVEDEVVAKTSSGGVCVNGTIWQIANPNLPFGGVGASGMGAYHGRHSFETFSHRKPVVKKTTRFDMKAMYPPYGKFKTNLVRKMF